MSAARRPSVTCALAVALILVATSACSRGAATATPSAERPPLASVSVGASFDATTTLPAATPLDDGAAAAAIATATAVTTVPTPLIPTTTEEPPLDTPTPEPAPTATDIPPDTSDAEPTETLDEQSSVAADALVIVIDVGHDASTGGALGIEYVDTLRTALATRDALTADGYEVYLTRDSDDTILYGDPDLMPDNADSMDPSYNEGYAHASAALEFNPDLLLSMHYNAADDPDVGGSTVYYCNNGGPQNATLAALVSDALANAFASLGYAPPYVEASEDSSIGKTYGDLATLGNVYSAPFDFVDNRLAGVPAVLTEALFETNPTERALLEDDATVEALAQAYTQAIDAYFGR